MDWLQKSPDHTLWVYFLWDAFKDIVYRNNPSTLDDLEQSICKVTEFISVQILQDVMANFVVRLRDYFSVRGDHFEQIVL